MPGYLLLLVFVVVVVVVAVIQYPRINTPYAWPDTEARPTAAEADLDTKATQEKSALSPKASPEPLCLSRVFWNVLHAAIRHGLGDRLV